jgi:hypothetical protein
MLASANQTTIPALRAKENEMATKKTGKKVDWSKREEVIKLLETDGRKLSEGEKQLIDGQRQINGHFFEAISAILETLSPAKGATKAKSARSLADLKKAFQEVPGDGPPGCVKGKQG